MISTNLRSNKLQDTKLCAAGAEQDSAQGPSSAGAADPRCSFCDVRGGRPCPDHAGYGVLGGTAHSFVAFLPTGARKVWTDELAELLRRQGFEVLSVADYRARLALGADHRAGSAILGVRS